MDDVVKQGKGHKSDWLFTAKDGHQFWIKANVAQVGKDVKVQCKLACWTDVSSNMMAEKSLQKRLDELNSAII